MYIHTILLKMETFLKVLESTSRGTNLIRIL
nr:MAG TPA: hypothetical protein [Caudoviricetes sp.]